MPFAGAHREWLLSFCDARNSVRQRHRKATAMLVTIWCVRAPSSNPAVPVFIRTARLPLSKGSGTPSGPAAGRGSRSMFLHVDCKAVFGSCNVDHEGAFGLPSVAGTTVCGKVVAAPRRSISQLMPLGQITYR